MRVTKQRAMVKSLIAKAIQGDSKAVERLVNMIDRLLLEQDERQAARPLSKEEQDVLETLAERLGTRAKIQDDPD